MCSGDDRLRTPRRSPRIALLVAATALGFAAPGITSASATPTGSGDVEFTISSAVTALPDCRAPAVLFPGVERCLRYTVHNDSSAAITVTSITIADVQAPPGCDHTNLDLAESEFTGALTVAAGAAALSPPLRIELLETGVNQDGCQGATFAFTFQGVATADDGANPQPPPSPPANETTGPDGGDGPDVPVTGANAVVLLGFGAAAVVVGAIAGATARRGRRAGAGSR